MSNLTNTQIFVLGDLHGNFKALQQALKKQKIQQAAIIQVGDFGVGYASFLKDLKAMEKLNAVLKALDSTLFVMRGNHDNPGYFSGEAPRALDQSHITFVADYTVLKINQLNFLLVGGAISIDRKAQVVGKNYWKEEVLLYDETKIKTLSNIDVVVTHSAPDFAPPFKFNDLVLTFAKNDPQLIDDLREERATLTEMYWCLKNGSGNRLSHWFYGHFHTPQQFLYENTQMVLVGINELVQLPVY